MADSSIQETKTKIIYIKIKKKVSFCAIVIIRNMIDQYMWKVVYDKKNIQNTVSQSYTLNQHLDVRT